MRRGFKLTPRGLGRAGWSPEILRLQPPTASAQDDKAGLWVRAQQPGSLAGRGDFLGARIASSAIRYQSSELMTSYAAGPIMASRRSRMPSRSPGRTVSVAARGMLPSQVQNETARSSPSLTAWRLHPAASSSAPKWVTAADGVTSPRRRPTRSCCSLDPVTNGATSLVLGGAWSSGIAWRKEAEGRLSIVPTEPVNDSQRLGTDTSNCPRRKSAPPPGRLRNATARLGAGVSRAEPECEEGRVALDEPVRRGQVWCQHPPPLGDVVLDVCEDGLLRRLRDPPENQLDVVHHQRTQDGRAGRDEGSEGAVGDGVENEVRRTPYQAVQQIHIDRLGADWAATTPVQTAR